MANKFIQVLLLEDDDVFSNVFAQIMQQKGHHVRLAATLSTFYSCIESNIPFDLILMDLKIGNETSLHAIQLARSNQPNAKIFMITAYASIATTVQAIKLGADDYLPKPFTVNDVLRVFDGKQLEIEEKALTTKQLEWEYIQKTLAENNGNISQTAKALNMHRRTLQRKLNKKP